MTSEERAQEFQSEGAKLPRLDEANFEPISATTHRYGILFFFLRRRFAGKPMVA